MKALRTLLFATLAAATIGGAPFVGDGQLFAQEQSEAAKPKLTKEQRRAERQQRITARATKATQLKIREGKSPSYNRLLKSTSYALMYTEGLRYFNTIKKGHDHTSMANLRKAQNLFATVAKQQAFSGTPQEDSLYYYYGCSYFQAQDFTTSQDIFDNFRRRYGSSRFIEDVEYRFASGFYYLSPDPKNDQSITIRAISAISEFMGRYPDTKHREICEQRMEELRRKLYTKSYENARLYFTIGRYNAAVRALNNAIDEYPQSPFREELMYLATRSAYMYAKNSVASQMTNRYLSMMDNYYNLISEFPETRHLREVEQMRDEARKHIEASTAAQTASATSSTTL
jgi:outer membrane protein assembly factor BamD